MHLCRYLVAPDGFEVSTDHGQTFRPAEAPRMLCAWAIYHPDAVTALTSAPPWAARNIMAGHLWRDGDCQGCAAYAPGRPVEEPRAA
jgi:hypothetical protein